MSEIRIPLVIVDTANDLFDTIELPLFANQLDIAPTLIQRLGLPVPGSWRGESILHRSRQDIAFQQEDEFYSAIFSIDDVILQLTYDQRRDLTALYDVTLGQNFPATLAVNPSRLREVVRSMNDFYRGRIEIDPMVLL